MPIVALAYLHRETGASVDELRTYGQLLQDAATTMDGEKTTAAALDPASLHLVARQAGGWDRIAGVPYTDLTSNSSTTGKWKKQAAWDDLIVSLCWPTRPSTFAVPDGNEVKWVSAPQAMAAWQWRAFPDYRVFLAWQADSVEAKIAALANL